MSSTSIAIWSPNTRSWRRNKQSPAASFDMTRSKRSTARKARQQRAEQGKDRSPADARQASPNSHILSAGGGADSNARRGPFLIAAAAMFLWLVFLAMMALSR